MSETNIPEVESHKHLGCFLSNDASWHEHISFIKNKAWTRINVMRRLKYVLDRKSLETIYISFVRPLLEYSDVVWDNCTNYEKDDIEKIQNEAARIVSGCTKLVSISELFLETGWETLTDRRRKHKLILFFKMIKGISPDFLCNLIPQSVGETSQYNLRNSLNLQVIPTRTSLYANLCPVYTKRMKLITA